MIIFDLEELDQILGGETMITITQFFVDILFYTLGDIVVRTIIYCEYTSKRFGRTSVSILHSHNAVPKKEKNYSYIFGSLMKWRVFPFNETFVTVFIIS